MTQREAHLENIMTDLEINKAIHEKVMGDCWHEWTRLPGYNPNIIGSWNGVKCLVCGAYSPYNPGDGSAVDYCSDLNAVHRAEVKVVETSGTTIPLMDAIERQVWPAGSSIWATARQRAEAVLRATGNWEDE